MGVSHALALGAHEGNHGVQPTIFSINAEYIWHPTRQVYMILANIVGDFLGTTHEGWVGRVCTGPRETSHENLNKLHIQNTTIETIIERSLLCEDCAIILFYCVMPQKKSNFPNTSPINKTSMPKTC